MSKIVTLKLKKKPKHPEHAVKIKQLNDDDSIWLVPDDDVEDDDDLAKENDLPKREGPEVPLSHPLRGLRYPEQGPAGMPDWKISTTERGVIIDKDGVVMATATTASVSPTEVGAGTASVRQ